jgi:LysM repeat protein
MGLFNFGGDEVRRKILEKLQNNLEKAGLDHLQVEVRGDTGVAISGYVSTEKDMEFIQQQGTALEAVGFSFYNEVEVEEAGYEVYVVKNGDTPWSIAEHFYGDGSKHKIIEEYNDIKGHIYTGDELYIPTLQSYVGPAKAQAILNALGYGAGRIDGVLGSQSKSALRKFQKDYELEVTGELDHDTRSALRHAFREESVELSTEILQFILHELGYYKGQVDGVMGPQTSKALNSFQHDNDLAQSQTINERAYEALKEAFVG